MTQEKQLLLKDLCARQFYGTKVLGPWKKDGPCELSAIDLTSNRQVRVFEDWCRIEDIKPYLRPMSSMTEDECKELGNIQATIENISEVIPNVPYYIEVAYSKQIDWLNAHHFDYRGLIEKELAIEAPKGMYNFKEK